MYYVQLDIRPTGGLTFRRMPGSIVHISTYRFVPPSTMSGYLRRLLMLSSGHYPNTSVRSPKFYVLPWPLYHVLGAYPLSKPGYAVHVTRRHGPRALSKHSSFSKLVRTQASTPAERNEQQLQLHTWEYLLVERLRGYVASEDARALRELHKVLNLGSKLGKEGYAYVEFLSEPSPLELKRVSAIPSVLTPASDLTGQPADFVLLYRHEHDGQITLEDLVDETPSPVKGFVPFWGGLSNEPLTTDFWTDGQVFIPASVLEVL